MLATKECIIAQRQFVTERYILSTLPVLYLPLYRLDGASFLSGDGAGHKCDVTGALWTPQGRSFDGSDDTVTVPDAACLDITGDLTIVVWANSSSDAANKGKVFGKGTSTLAKDKNYAIDVTNAGAIYGWFGDGTNFCGWGKAGAISLNLYHHLAFSYIGTTIYVYADGVDIGATLVGGSTATTKLANNAPLRLGTDDGTYDCKGSIGDLLLYNRGLSPVEVQQIYLATKWRY